jgi:hypothetical protein
MNSFTQLIFMFRDFLVCPIDVSLLGNHLSFAGSWVQYKILSLSQPSDSF